MCYTILEIFDLENSSRSASSNGIIYEHDELGGTWFDQNEVIRRLHETFSSITLGTEDPLIEEAKKAEAYFASQGEDVNSVVRSLYNKANVYGPALTFRVPTKKGETIQGLVRRYDIRFVYRRSTSAEIRRRIKDFLQSFAIGKVEERECKE